MTSSGTGETRWWWIRHAPVPDGGRIYGQRDVDCDCSDPGIFDDLARELPGHAVWLTSALARTAQTAAAILRAAPQRFEGVTPTPIADLNEQHLGDWQGLDRKTFYAERGVGTRTLWFAAADEHPPGGESFADLVARVSPVILRLTTAHRGGDIVAVTHGGTIRAALALALGIPPQTALSFAIENCSLTRLDHLGPATADAVWRVAFVNHRPWGRKPRALAVPLATPQA
jgi:broad specificity phosphatase PhoE